MSPAVTLWCWFCLRMVPCCEGVRTCGHPDPSPK